jgi:AcrR family transcriptional regulator
MAKRLGTKDACVAEAMGIVAQAGPEALSLREVARRLGVSHQAPYKHFPSRDHLLAELLRRAFVRLTDALNARDHAPSPIDDLRALGKAYLGFAASHPLEYCLMFGAPWPARTVGPELLREARFSFDVLRVCMRRLHAEFGIPLGRVDADALFVWSSMHGLAAILASDAAAPLDLLPGTRENMPAHASAMIDAALFAAARAKPKRRGKR